MKNSLRLLGTLTSMIAFTTACSPIAGRLASVTVPLALTSAATQGGENCSLTLNTRLPIGNGTFRLEYPGPLCLPSSSPTPSRTPIPTAPTGGPDLAGATIVGSPDVRGWAVTSRITNVAFGGGRFRIDHTKRGQWPGVDIGGALQEATVWVFFNINGTWYGTGGERLRPGQNEKELSAPSAIGPGWLYDRGRWGAMTNYVPRPGEMVGFMVAAGSTRSDNHAPLHERSNVVAIPFPADGASASFPPFAFEER